VSVVKALAESCDVFFYQVGLKLGVDRLAWYAKAFGLGEHTGVDLDHESKGLIPTAAWKRKRTGIPWQRGETLSVAIGQGYNLVTPLQMAVLTAAVANGGVLYRPQILSRVETAGGEVVLKNEKEIAGKLPVGEKTLGIVKKGLWEVVNGSRGTARVAKLKDCEICGKTGTAQIVGRKKNENIKDSDREKRHRAHAWFVAYAPSENPQIAAAIIVEHGEHGSSAASPIARDLFATYFELEKKR
jgi:penicillin-binding protein 2